MISPVSIGSSMTSKRSHASDLDLLEAVCDRNPRALEILFETHAALLRTIISRAVQNDADVDDVYLEVMEQVWNRCEDFDAEKGAPLGWMITLARRRGIDRARRIQAYNRAEERMRLETEEQENSFSEDQSVNSDRAAVIAKLLLDLPDAQRQVVEFAFYRGLSQREIARELGVSLGTIKTRYELGLRKLKSALMAVSLDGSSI